MKFPSVISIILISIIYVSDCFAQDKCREKFPRYCTTKYLQERHDDYYKFESEEAAFSNLKSSLRSNYEASLTFGAEGFQDDPRSGPKECKSAAYKNVILFNDMGMQIDTDEKVVIIKIKACAVDAKNEAYLTVLFGWVDKIHCTR